MKEDMWVMEEECCSTCGTLLDPFEDVLCTDCLHDAWYAEDQEKEAAWFNEDDDMKEESEKERENPPLRSDSEATKNSRREILAKKMRDWYWWFWVRWPRR